MSNDQRINRMLIVGPSWVGDMVMAQSLLKLLRQIHDDMEITVLAPSWSQALLARMPEVDHAIELPFGHGELKLLRRREFARKLKGQFDSAIILPNSFKSALIPFFAGVGQRTGWQGEFRNMLLTDCRKLDPGKYPLMVQRFLALGLVPGAGLITDIPRPDLHSDSIHARKTARELNLDCDNKILAICPGAEFGEAKQWPASHYARLCEIASANEWKIWIIGSANDREVATEIFDQIDLNTRSSCINVTGNTSLSQVVDLLYLAGAVVSNDSGLMHIAAAVGCPVVALYGSTSPDFTPPMADRVKSLTTDIACRPCFKRICPLGHKRCLTEISAERVYKELSKLTEM